MFPIKPDIKDICESKNQSHFPHNFFENVINFHENI